MMKGTVKVLLRDIFIYSHRKVHEQDDLKSSAIWLVALDDREIYTRSKMRSPSVMTLIKEGNYSRELRVKK